MAKKSSSQLIVLSLLAIVSLALYLGYNLPNRWQYALENRALSLIAIVITGAAIALATMIFQTVVNNRILTPSILGFRFTVFADSNNDYFPFRFEHIAFHEFDCIVCLVYGINDGVFISALSFPV